MQLPPGLKLAHIREFNEASKALEDELTRAEVRWRHSYLSQLSPEAASNLIVDGETTPERAVLAVIGAAVSTLLARALLNIKLAEREETARTFFKMLTATTCATCEQKSKQQQ